MARKVKGETITYQECATYLFQIPLRQLKESENFVKGDHWNGGLYWIGWRPVPDEHGNYSEAQKRQWQYVCESFTQKNVIGSNVKRLEGAILGNEPDFDIVSAATKITKVNQLAAPAANAVQKTAEDKYFEKVDSDFVNYWTLNDVHKSFKEVVKNKASYGKYAVITYVPGGYLEPKVATRTLPDGTVERKQVYALSETNPTFESVLNKIKVEVVHYSNFIDVYDPAFGNKFTIVRLEPDENGVGRIGVYYVGVDNMAYLRVVKSDESSNQTSMDLGGNSLCLTYGEYEDALVTASVKSLQRGVNHAETGSNYALANINYPETTFINAAPIEKVDKHGNPTGEMAQPKQGFGIYRFLRGLVQETINGVVLTTPTIHERKAADPEKFSKESEKKARDIDMLMGMGFKHLADSEYASGDSKAKSMDDLDILMSDYETSMNTLGTKVVENVIRLAYNFLNETHRNKDFNVLFRVNMSQGKLTSEDKAGMREEVATGLRSRESYMLNAKVSDNPKNEIQRIEQDPPLQLQQGNEPPKPKPAPAT